MSEPGTKPAGKKNLLPKQILSFLACLMLMIVVPIWRDHKLIGFNLPDGEGAKKIETVTDTPDGILINTTELGRDIIGYGGPTPVEILISHEGVIKKITPLPNQETPEFFGAVRNSDLLETLDGKTLEESPGIRLDGVSGATYSSNAVIGNIKRGLAFAADSETVKAAEENASAALPVKFYFVLAVVLLAGIVPWFVKNKIYRTIQLLLNVGILGFWGGTFMSYSLMTSYLTNGITKLVLIPTALMLIAAFIFPFFGKRNYYCSWMCPYGSIQELLGKTVGYKLKLSPALVKWLNYFREGLWFVLMWLLWTGLCFDWMGLEPFAAFFFRDASLAVLIIAGVFLLLSFVIQRPYCRFVCPTGSLFKLAEGSY